MSTPGIGGLEENHTDDDEDLSLPDLSADELALSKANLKKPVPQRQSGRANAKKANYADADGTSDVE